MPMHIYPGISAQPRLHPFSESGLDWIGHDLVGRVQQSNLLLASDLLMPEWKKKGRI